MALQAASLLSEVVTPLGQLGQADCPGLVGIQQTLVGSGGAIQPRAELLVGGAVARGSGFCRGGKMLEPGQQLLRIG